AAAKVQLNPGRSMAVDRLKHVFGSALYVVAPTVNFGDGKTFQRLMIAQDTGSAIIGNARGDLFTGSGFEAGEIAGRIKAPADFYLLMPRHLVV
ncbi:MAG: 3D domain-containing protein, partial [Rhizobiaceae bacterium]